MDTRFKKAVLTYVGVRAEIEVSPRRKRYNFERNKSQPIGHKRDEIHPKDADLLARKINNLGEFLFLVEQI